MTFHLFSRNCCKILEGHFAWQAQYLMMLERHLCCSAHSNAILNDADQSCESFCVAGAVFGDVGETPLLLRAL